MRITPTIVRIMKAIFLSPTILFTHPNAIARKMNKIEAEATPGLATNVFAIMSENTPMTRMRVEKLKRMKSCFPLKPIWFRIMTPIDFPSVRREAAMLPKSWTAPKKIPPARIQITAGIQPNVTAMMGPTIGPAPAIEAKWCPKTTIGLLGS